MFPISGNGGYDDEARQKTPLSNPFPQGVAQRRREMASKGALPPALGGAPQVGRKTRCKALKSLISRNEKEAQEPLFRWSGKGLGMKGAFRRQKALISARKGEL
jgi:hypothetical protein